MKNCPSCSFLMDDDQDRCGHCQTEAEQRSVLDSLSAADTGITLPSGGGTAVLAPPRVAPMPETVKFRSNRPTVSPKALLLCVPLIALAVAVAGWAGMGPLAPKFVDWGFTRSTSDVLSSDWVPVMDPSRSFEVTMPAGAADVFDSLDPANPEGGGLVGKHADGTEGASVEVTYTDFALGPDGLAAYESQQGVRDLGAKFMAAHMTGQQTVVRDALVPEGHAVDTVLINGDHGTSRVRFVLAGGRFYALTTTGPDSASQELDASHQRLLASFDPQT